ncbi:MAG: hypothetical protein LUE64_05835 [Candidatus Gastranaerophilales bacterium]|nr:hypothetical protein [Candidatus Gastranaerophilales bacterium]
MGRKKRRRRKRTPSFTKFYHFNLQDDLFLRYEGFLQDIHSQIAKEIFYDVPSNCPGDWTICVNGINLYIDPVFGSQCEISGSANLPLYLRIILHAEFLKLIKKGCSTLKALKLCHLILKTQ